MGRIANFHFNGFANLLMAAKEPIGEILNEQFQNAEEKIHSQFKMEKAVYCQDNLYSNQLSIIRSKSTAGFGLQASLVSADLREIAYHLTSYLTVIFVL